MSFRDTDTSKPHKTILLVGESRKLGVGKSTIINTMINHMLSVNCEDGIWYEIIETKRNQTTSQTSEVTVYDVFTEQSPFSLTVIDTPGFGSTDGEKKDSETAGSLLELFRSKNGVDEMDAVCFVVTSVTTRLTDRQRYVFNAVLSLFGKDVKGNIVVLIAHASRKPSNAIKAIKKSGIPCAQTDKGEPVYFRFDSFHCEDFEDEETLEEYQASWDLLNETMESFKSFLTESKTISLGMTVAVLKKRNQLTASILNLEEKIKLTELKQKELEMTKQSLLEHEKQGGQSNWEYEVEEVYKDKVKIEHNWWQMFTTEATSCSVCEENCHYPGCWWVRDLSWCSVMSEGMCTVCTGRCHYTKHVKEGKMYMPKTRKVKKTKNHLKMKYNTKSGEIKSIIDGLQSDIAEQEKSKMGLVEECCQCVVKLEEIALKSDSVYTLQHLDFLIEKVKETGNTTRVQRLEEMKRRAEQAPEQTTWHYPVPKGET